MPIVTMVSYAIVYRNGLENYVRDAKAAGAAGAIVPDLLVEESAALAEICRREDFSLIQLITPTTPRDRQLRIAATSTPSSAASTVSRGMSAVFGDGSSVPTSMRSAENPASRMRSATKACSAPLVSNVPRTAIVLIGVSLRSVSPIGWKPHRPPAHVTALTSMVLNAG